MSSKRDVIFIRGSRNIFIRGGGVSVLPAQEFQFLRQDLHEVVVDTLVILPGSLLELSPDADLGTLCAVLYLHQTLEGSYPEPVGLFDLLAALPF